MSLREDFLGVDIETDGLYRQCTKVHCIVINGQLYDTPEEIERALRRLMDSSKYLVGHNLIKFDLPVLRKLYPWFSICESRIADTYIWACLVFPDPDSKGTVSGFPMKLHNRQSLESWGYRLGELKGDYGATTDWQTYTQEMGEYCVQDVRVTMRLLLQLLKAYTSAQALELEFAVANIIGHQEREGVHFNRDKALQLYVELTSEHSRLLHELRILFPAWTVVDKVFTPKRDNKRYGYKEGVPVTKYKTIEFNPNSAQHIIYWLNQRYGWTPIEFTAPTPSAPSGNPKLDEDILKDLPFPEAAMLCSYKTVVKRMSQLISGKQAWLKHYDEESGKIYGSVASCAASTRRMTHSRPNLGQVPANRSPYGKECRELFEPPPGMVMVGTDADQLELRTLGELLSYFDSGAYIEILLTGSKEDKTDIHWVQTRAMGQDDRDKGKTLFYAYIYGAGLEKLGRIVTESWDKAKNISVGRMIKANLLKNLPAIQQLKDSIASSFKKNKFLKDLDGQRFVLRSLHSSLNELNQKAGAIIMKRAQVIWWGILRELGWVLGTDFGLMLTVHDEWQVWVRPGYEHLLGAIMSASLVLAGEYYKFKCPLAGEWEVGNSWKETH